MFLKVRLRRAYRTIARRLFLSLSPRARPAGADEKRMKDLADSPARVSRQKPDGLRGAGGRFRDGPSRRAGPKRGSRERRPHGARRGSRDSRRVPGSRPLRPVGVHAGHDLRAVRDVHGCCAVGPGRPARVRLHARRFGRILSGDVPLREIDRGTFADLVRRHRPRRPRRLPCASPGSRVRRRAALS